MSRRTKTTRIPFPPKLLATLAIGSITALGLAFTGPAGSAVAEASTPQARVAASIEHGRLQQDVESGRITDADWDAAAATGIDVAGQHIPAWTDATSGQADDGAAQADDDDAAAAEQLAAASPTDDAIAEQKIFGIHWPNIHIPPIHIPVPHIHWPHIHIPTIHPPHVVVTIDHPYYFFDNAEVRAIITGGAGVAVASVCAYFKLNKYACGALAGVVAGGVEYLKTKGICDGHGWTLSTITPWKSHCGH
ncbi:hypothetical protein BFL36_12880 [Clavibacter michiganensis]|uniref:Secreted protein n=1 Tax=Clavibacter michiganensis TaxID=28447 RepID=A0A251Y3Q6_9MICO|nr:hypothetical protein [Clavibacter michiganensis]OUE18930.1 hypothetical protein BFL36_12880 [Clavibacter michiganensis]